jgi:hypothetical protein
MTIKKSLFFRSDCLTGHQAEHDAHEDHGCILRHLEDRDYHHDVHHYDDSDHERCESIVMEIEAAVELIRLCQGQFERPAEIYEYNPQGRFAILNRDIGAMTVFEGSPAEIKILGRSWTHNPPRWHVLPPAPGTKNYWHLPA